MLVDEATRSQLHSMVEKNEVKQELIKKEHDLQAVKEEMEALEKREAKVKVEVTTAPPVSPGPKSGSSDSSSSSSS